MNSHLRPIYEWLLGKHPAAPWAVLALCAHLANLAAERLGIRGVLVKSDLTDALAVLDALL